MSPGAQRDVARAVLAAVVDADDVVENRANIGDDVADDARLVKGGNDDPNILVTHVDADQNTRSAAADALASAARCTAIPTIGPHSRATTVRVSRPSGSSSNSIDATVALIQPAEYARCSAAATVAAPVSVSSAIAMAAVVSQASSAPPARYSSPNATRSSHGPNNPAASHAHRAQPGDDRRRCQQGPQPLCALVDEVRDQVALHRRQRHQQRRAGQRHRQDHHAARRAQVARRRLEQHRKTHHQDRAGAGGGDRVRGAAQERRCPAGRQQSRPPRASPARRSA